MSATNPSTVATNPSTVKAPPSIFDAYRPLATCLVLTCLILWLLFTGWNGYLFFHTAFAGPDPNAVDCNTGRITMNWAHTTACQTKSFNSFFNPSIIAINFFGLLAALAFAFSFPTSLAKVNATRLSVAGTSFAMMIGRMVDAGISGSLLSILQTPDWILYVLTPFVMGFAGFTAILAFGTAIASIFGVLIGVPSLLFNQIIEFESTLRVHRYETTGLSGYIVRFAYWLQRKELPEPPPDESRGARIASRQEVVAIHRPNAPDSMVFGHLGRPFHLRTDKHVLIMASTRSGKGVTLIIPHLLRYRGSAFVLDPKGENARATGRQRAELNDSVHYLDPFGISSRPQSRFNPLSRFTPDNMEAESKALASALFVVGDRERDHWTASGQQLLAAIILYVYASPEIPPDQKDLPTVRRILLGGLDLALDAMLEMTEADGLLSSLAVSFQKTPEKEFGSIVSTAQRQTEILDNPAMIACLKASGPGPEVDFKAWHRGTMTVFLCLSAPKFPTFNRWLRLVLTSALDEMTDTLNPPPLPVCFMLDELATLGHLPAVENAVGLAAGYGIQLVTVFQDVAQMRDLYKGRWASFIGNSGVRALFNLDDFETAEYWSKFIGGTLAETHSRNEDAYGQSKGQNVGEAMRPLFPPDKLMMYFATGKMLVLAQGQRPIITDRVAYFSDASLNGLWDDPRANTGMTQTPDLPPTPAGPDKPPPPRSDAPPGNAYPTTAPKDPAAFGGFTNERFAALNAAKQAAAAPDDKARSGTHLPIGVDPALYASIAGPKKTLEPPEQSADSSEGGAGQTSG